MPADECIKLPQRSLAHWTERVDRRRMLTLTEGLPARAVR